MVVYSYKQATRKHRDSMTLTEEKILDNFKNLLLKKIRLHKLILFGSRARGEAGPYSDMDVVVILQGVASGRAIDYVSDCAWEAGYEHGIVIIPIVFSKEEWENSPERYSLLSQAVKAEGITV